ncbi:MAG TPA: metallophosphoesterase family protein [Methylovirgula sp.]|nr:metallophosphoesterase family protein [Methylovirgula sp.]
MLIALLSDIHANREAFDACLADARRRGAEQFVFLGDLVGYGADPAYVVDRVTRMRSEGALVIKGNHDAAIDNGQATMNRHAQLAIDWTRQQLDDTQRQFLANLPLMVSLGELLFVHAEASHPTQWVYISRLVDAERSMQATEMRVTVSGHIHRPHLFHMASQKPAACFIPTTDVPILLAKSHKWHAIIGSVGQPRDEMASAAYALYDDRSGLLTFVRSTYDIERAAHKIKQAGLPAVLAARLYVGR